MGKRGARRGRGAGGSSSSRPKQDDRDKGNYDLETSVSEQFKTYYRAQNVVPDSEWDNFLTVAQAPLPLTFRVTSSREASKAVNEHVEQEFVPFLSNVVFDGVQQTPPKKLDWYPGGHAWQLNTAKHVVRKSPEFAKFQQFLVHETDSGNISRQEAVSMIPPLLLDVKPEHVVLDCCAAPGSKTVQLLEALHARGVEGQASSTIPPGLLVANDSDAKRCHMLVHQSLNRIGSPNTMITNLDAANIPTIRVPGPNGHGTRTLYFDRILCDVPCSGDGTSRKNPNVCRSWKPADGLGLHPLQLRILLRAIQSLRQGGRLVYSTCSYNPIENEAVVSAALAACPNMSLVEVEDQLPGLQRRKGLTTWKVFDKQMKELENQEAWEATGIVAKGKKEKAPPATCWPNGKEAEFHMERCLRLYPHLQDTGGFFVAVLQKADKPANSGASESSKPAVAQKAEQIADEVATEAGTSAAAEEAGRKRAASPTGEAAPAKRIKQDAENGSEATAPTPSDAEEGDPREGGGRPFNEEPYTFLSADDDQVKICRDFFGLTDEFPVDSLFVRNGEGKALRSIYLTSPAVKDVISVNDYRKMRLVSCGVKLFSRQDSGSSDTYTCKWRILQDGLNVISQYMSPRRKVTADLATLKRMIEEQYASISSFGETQFAKDVQELENGSCICTIQAGEMAGGKLENSIEVPIWRAPVSLCLMIEKMDKRGLSLRIFGEDLSVNAYKKKESKGALATAQEDGKAEEAAAAELETAKEEVGEANVA